MGMTNWSDSDSLLAPIIIGAHNVGDYAYYVTGALQAAAECIPPTSIQVKAVLRKQQHVRTRKSMFSSGEKVKPYASVVHLVEVADNEPMPVPAGHLLWSVGMCLLAAGAGAPIISPDIHCLSLEVTFSKVSRGLLIGSPQLALLRHLWVEFMRAYDPDLIVVGGQTRFHEEWWRPNAAPVDANTTGT